MNDYTEIVTGRIVDRSGTPVAGARVEVWDKDLIADDYLGTDTTAVDGRFRIDFGWAEYKDTPFAGRPDIFLKVHHPASGKTTKSRVFSSLTGQLSADDSEEVMDLGEVPVD